MRPSQNLLDRCAATLVDRLTGVDFVDLVGSASDLKSRVVMILTKNFDEEDEIVEEARKQAEELVRKGAPGVRREELDLRRVEKLMLERVAKERGFAL